MKLNLTVDFETDHDHLSQLFNMAMLANLKHVLEESGVRQHRAFKLAGTSLESLARVMDEGKIVVNGKTYQPRVAFISEDGEMVRGAAEFDTLTQHVKLTPEDLVSERDFQIEI